MASVDAAAGLMAVEVAWSASPQHTGQATVQLQHGSTALDALRASGVADELGADLLDTLTLALWGRVGPQWPLLAQHRRAARAEP